MLIRKLIRLTGACLLLHVLGGAAFAQEGALVDDEVLVKFMDHASEADRKALESQNGLILVKHHTSIGVYHYRSAGGDVWSLVAKIRSSPFVFWFFA